MMLRPGMVTPKDVAAAFPFVQSRATDPGTGSNTSSHDINLPTGITAGDLLVAVCTCNTTLSATGWTFSTPVTSHFVGLVIGYKTATGSEGATETFASGAGTHFASVVLRISGWGAIELGTPVASSATPPDPPSFTPSWGAKNTLWIACAAVEGGAPTVTGFPTNYSNGQTDNTAGFTTDYAVATAERQLNAASEDPGTFTIGSGNQWVTNTIAIKPAA